MNGEDLHVEVRDGVLTVTGPDKRVLVRRVIDDKAAAAGNDSDKDPQSVNVHVDTSDNDDLEAIFKGMPPEVLQRIAPSDLTRIIERAQQSQQMDRDDWVVPVLVPTGFFAMLVAIVAVIQWARLRREQRLHETIRQMVDRGVDVPLQAFLPPPRNDQRRGVLLVMLGTGLTIACGAAAGWSGAAVGLVPGLVGLGYLVAHRLESRR